MSSMKRELTRKLQQSSVIIPRVGLKTFGMRVVGGTNGGPRIDWGGADLGSEGRGTY